MARTYNIVSNKELGRYLRYYRNVAGLTAVEAAERSGLGSSQTIFNIESGKSKPDFQRIAMLLETYGVPYDDAFTEPLEVVMNPSRKKKPGSVRTREMTRIFSELTVEDQRLLLRVARALRDKETGDGESSKSIDKEEG